MRFEKVRFAGYQSSIVGMLSLTKIRMGKAEEIADVVCFLFSDESSYMNGAVVQIDGGMSRHS